MGELELIMVKVGMMVGVLELVVLKVEVHTMGVLSQTTSR